MNTDAQMILLVEDSPDDAFFLQYELKKTGPRALVRVVENGQEAMDYLAGAGKYVDRVGFPFPSVIFLDLKLPLLSGFELLAWMRQETQLSRVPVFVLTGSSEPCDCARALDLGARDFFVKPLRAERIREIMESLVPGAVR